MGMQNPHSSWVSWVCISKRDVLEPIFTPYDPPTSTIIHTAHLVDISFVSRLQTRGIACLVSASLFPLSLYSMLSKYN